MNEKRVAQVGPAAPTEITAAPAVARRLESDLSDTEIGRALTSLWLRHSVELNQLVNHNRRVLTRWHRAGGAALFQCGVRSVHDPALPIPASCAAATT